MLWQRWSLEVKWISEGKSHGSGGEPKSRWSKGEDKSPRGGGSGESGSSGGGKSLGGGSELWKVGEGKSQCGVGEPKTLWSEGDEKTGVECGETGKKSGKEMEVGDGESQGSGGKPKSLWSKGEEGTGVDNGNTGKKSGKEMEVANVGGIGTKGGTDSGGVKEKGVEKDVEKENGTKTLEVCKSEKENVWVRKERERTNVFVKNWELTGLCEESKYAKLPVAMTEVEREADVEVSYMGNEFEVYDVERDGNCVFRAVSLAVLGTEECHAELRKMVVEAMVKKIKDGSWPEVNVKATLCDMTGEERWYGESLEKCSSALVAMVKQDGFWVGHECLFMLTRVLNVSIVVVMVSSAKGYAFRMDCEPVVSLERSEVECEMYLRFVDANHYQLMVPKKKEKVQWGAVGKLSGEGVGASKEQRMEETEDLEKDGVTWTEVKSKKAVGNEIKTVKKMCGSGTKTKQGKKNRKTGTREESVWVDVKKGGRQREPEGFGLRVSNKFQVLKEESDEQECKMAAMEVKNRLLCSCDKQKWKGIVVKGMEDLPDWNRWDVLRTEDEKQKNKKKDTKKKSLKRSKKATLSDGGTWLVSEGELKDEVTVSVCHERSKKVFMVDNEKKEGKQVMSKESNIGGTGVGGVGSTPKKSVGRPKKRGQRRGNESVTEIQQKCRTTPMKSRRDVDILNGDKSTKKLLRESNGDVAKRKLTFDDTVINKDLEHRLDKGSINEPYVHGRVSAKIERRVRLGFRVGIGRVVYFAGGRGCAKRFQFGKRYRDCGLDERLDKVRKQKAEWKTKYGTYVHMVEEGRKRCGDLSRVSVYELESEEVRTREMLVKLKNEVRNLKKADGEGEDLGRSAKALNLKRLEVRVAQKEWGIAYGKLKSKRNLEREQLLRREQLMRIQLKRIRNGNKKMRSVKKRIFVTKGKGDGKEELVAKYEMIAKKTNRAMDMWSKLRKEELYLEKLKELQSLKVSRYMEDMRHSWRARSFKSSAARREFHRERNRMYYSRVIKKDTGKMVTRRIRNKYYMVARRSKRKEADLGKYYVKERRVKKLLRRLAGVPGWEQRGAKCDRIAKQEEWKHRIAEGLLHRSEFRLRLKEHDDEKAVELVEELKKVVRQQVDLCTGLRLALAKEFWKQYMKLIFARVKPNFFFWRFFKRMAEDGR